MRPDFNSRKLSPSAPQQSLRDVQGGTYKDPGGKSQTGNNNPLGRKTNTYNLYFPAVLIIQEPREKLGNVNLAG